MDVTQLAAVGSCNFTSAQDLPPCLIERVAKIGADAPVAASDGPADAAAGELSGVMFARQLNPDLVQCLLADTTERASEAASAHCVINCLPGG